MMRFQHVLCATLTVAAVSGCPYYGGDPGEQDYGCVESYECDDLEFCNAGECDTGLDRRYRVVIDSAEAATTGPAGAWDVGGGAPDLFVQWGMLDSAAENWLDECFTGVVQDSFEAYWNTYCEFVFSSGDTFGITVWDEDSSTWDWAGGVIWQGNDALISVIRAQGAMNSVNIGDAVTVAWSIEPTF